MSAVTVQQMADRVAELLEQRLGLRGAGLAEKLRRGGRLLPRKVRAAAQDLAQAAMMAQNAKLLMRIDDAEVARNYDLCVRHLGTIKAGSRRIGLAVGMASSVAFSVLAVVVIVLAVLVWRGFV